MALHKMLVKFRNSENMLQMFFNSLNSARTAIETLDSPDRTMGDDYGAILALRNSDDVSAIIILDLEASARAAGEEALINGRENARVNHKAQRDPAMTLQAWPQGMRWGQG
jgi:hypothetical protein